MILLILYNHFLLFFLSLRLNILKNPGIIDITIGYIIDNIKLKLILLIKSICEFLNTQQKQLI